MTAAAAQVAVETTAAKPAMTVPPIKTFASNQIKAAECKHIPGDVNSSVAGGALVSVEGLLGGLLTAEADDFLAFFVTSSFFVLLVDSLRDLLLETRGTGGFFVGSDLAEVPVVEREVKGFSLLSTEPLIC